MAKSTKEARRGGAQFDRDLKAIAMIKKSGLLNPDAKLDEVLRASEQAATRSNRGGHIFIFRNVVLVECPH